MRVNDDIEFVSLHKNPEDIEGFTPESHKSLFVLKHDKCNPSYLNAYIEHGYYVESVPADRGEDE